MRLVAYSFLFLSIPMLFVPGCVINIGSPAHVEAGVYSGDMSCETTVTRPLFPEPIKSEENTVAFRVAFGFDGKPLSNNFLFSVGTDDVEFKQTSTEVEGDKTMVNYATVADVSGESTEGFGWDTIYKRNSTQISFTRRVRVFNQDTLEQVEITCRSFLDK